MSPLEQVALDPVTVTLSETEEKACAEGRGGGRDTASSPGAPGVPGHWEKQQQPSPGASGRSEALGHLDVPLLVPRPGEDACLWF